MTPEQKILIVTIVFLFTVVTLGVVSLSREQTTGIDPKKNSISAKEPLPVTGTVELGASSVVSLDPEAKLNVNPVTLAEGSKVSLDSGTVVTLTPATTVGVTGTVDLNPATSLTVRSEESSLDAFSRLRVSQPNTLFESMLTTDKHPLIWDEIVPGASTADHLPNESAVQLVATNGVEVIRQSFQYVNYNPGKSLLLQASLVFGTPVAGGVQNVGLFDDQNGVFLSQRDTPAKLYFTLRSFTSGAAVDVDIVQSLWNLDKLDGTGPSGFTLDPTNTLLLVIDLQWLGVGRVRCGFFLFGKIVWAHQFLNAGLDAVYMTRPSLPVRYSVTGGTTSSSSMKQICSSVQSEAGQNRAGTIRTFTMPAAVAVPGAEVVLISFRLTTAYIRSTFLPLRVISAIVTSGNNDETFVIRLRYRTVATGTASWVVVPGTPAVEYNVDATGFTPGFEVMSTFLSAATGSNPIELATSEEYLGSSIAGIPSQVCITATNLSGGVKNIMVGLTWREIS